jgi:hypothetical protein
MRPPFFVGLCYSRRQLFAKAAIAASRAVV